MSDTNGDGSPAPAITEARTASPMCTNADPGCGSPMLPISSVLPRSSVPPAPSSSSVSSDRQQTRRPRLTPAIADVRRAVRRSLRAVATQSGEDEQGEVGGAGSPDDGAESGGAGSTQTPLVLVGLSGGADSLALAAATAFEAPRARIRAGAIIVDHGLQKESAAVAARAAEQAQHLGLKPVRIVRVEVGSEGGPEAAARTARYEALSRIACETQAAAVLLAHTRDDQAETVLLGLARGSGAASLQGMAAVSGLYCRPLLGLDRQVTRTFCADSGLEPWHDPQNADPAYARVRVRERVLPVLEAELGPGIAHSLARTAEQLREDASALEDLAAQMVEGCVKVGAGHVSIPVRLLADQPPALRARMLRLVARAHFGVAWERVHVLAVSGLVTNWHGQRALDLPGCAVSRIDAELVFRVR